MKTMKMWLAATMTLACVVTAVRARPPMNGPEEPNGFRMQGISAPRVEGRMRRNDSKRELDRFMRGLGRLERSGAPLTQAQAQRIVALIRPWQSRPTMTQVQAKTLTENLNAVLSTQQKSALNAKRHGRRGPRPDGMRGGNFGGMRGPHGEGGKPSRDGFDGPPRRGERAFDPQKMRAQRQEMRAFRNTMNPFYPPSNSSQIRNLPERMQEGMARRHAQTQMMLNALSRRASGR